jgi:hypothetical protein
MKRLLATATVLVVMGALPAMASSLTNPDNGGLISFWGPSSADNQSYGTVFTAPQPVLDDFTVWVDDADTSFPFVAQVYAWNGSTTTGPALYTSGVEATTGAITPYTFSPDIMLTTGDSYIAFVTNQPGGVSLGGSGNGNMEASSGPLTFLFAEGDPQGGSWFTYSTNAEFKADFSSVPEPAAWTLLLAGFGALGGALRTRRRQPATA